MSLKLNSSRSISNSSNSSKSKSKEFNSSSILVGCHHCKEPVSQKIKISKLVPTIRTKKNLPKTLCKNCEAMEKLLNMSLSNIRNKTHLNAVISRAQFQTNEMFRKIELNSNIKRSAPIFINNQLQTRAKGKSKNK